MIVKLLYLKKTGPVFPGIRYNTNKVDRNIGELMKVANFGALQALANLRPQDYINYLQTISALNPNVRKPQFHAVISGKGRLYDKDRLTEIAGKWMQEMGYGKQPYLIIYHKDTENNHVHLVSSRVNRNGEKIDSAYEKVRSLKTMNAILGYDYAFSYQFSTRAQFNMLLEQAGFLGIDPDHKKIADRIANYSPDQNQLKRVQGLLMETRGRADMMPYLRDQHGLELIFHASEGKKPYGYTIIDHQSKAVYKGSEVLSMKHLSVPDTRSFNRNSGKSDSPEENIRPDIHIQSIYIADDVDDQQVLGMKRRRQQKARTNTR